MPFKERFRKAVLGPARDLHDPHISHKMALVAFLAWVGLGADGLSSSAYGPEEAYRALGQHTYLAVALMAATAVTVFIISYAYSKIIEHFPMGGGGYLVASQLLGKPAGVISGAALLVDYVLTITVSIAGGGDAIFSLLPLSWARFKLPAEYLAIVFLIVMNLRGVKESVQALIPIFLTFIATHLILIFGGILSHAGDIPALASGVADGFQTGMASVGGFGLFLIAVRAYSMGAGTYTGIEAISNGVGILREPRVATGKRTMVYMGTSLAITAGGLLLCYMLFHVQAVEGRTLNAVLAEAFAGNFYIGNLPVGRWFAMVTIFSEAILLLVAAQTGFIDGPRVMANMATDSWLPRRFAGLSDRLTMLNGILMMGLSAMALLAYSHGRIQTLVIMYSINVFLTFSLSLLGMSRFYIRHRKTEPRWKRDLFIQLVGLVLCVSILIIMVFEKMREGAWMTVLITSTLIGICFLINRHYRDVTQRIREIDKVFEDLPTDPAGAHPIPTFYPQNATAVILVGGYGGLGIHIFLTVFRLFAETFKNVVFVSVGVVDSSLFKDGKQVTAMEEETQKTLERYVALAHSMGIPAQSAYRIGTDVVEEASDLCVELSKQYARATFFAGEIMFSNPKWYHRFLHNHTPIAIQQKIRHHGLNMMILPVLDERGRLAGGAK